MYIENVACGYPLVKSKIQHSFKTKFLCAKFVYGSSSSAVHKKKLQRLK